ncbi:UV DNA damage endonuclease [Geosmithia morbida]|uniref:UV DNA damage endonuclease n=1 Tax=Geosmithia morbida TaxID=1094350 RepID=A0A9P4YPB8_9HYPO|nr:UV DNA damage endonuclease [Geosmithia morbida]KAF4120651.1 UV DNA damage endonuclease [Geosmithia morbida]
MPSSKRKNRESQSPPTSNTRQRFSTRVASRRAEEIEKEGQDAIRSDSVERAVRKLKEMEDQLQNIVRKERRAVETSRLDDKLADGKTRIDNAKLPRTSIPINHVINGKPGDHGSSSDLDTGEDDSVPWTSDAAKDQEEVERGARRAPPVNSERLPLPWTGRLGYACLNTYLRASNPPVFSSRTCRISSIIDHRYPLEKPDQPEHAVKNRPDKTKKADERLGVEYVREIGLANARDVKKVLRWNDRFGIKFMRLSSDMFPFASHRDYGYELAPFAASTLAEIGQVAAELGHRLTVHPGQYTQLGSPRKEVVTAAVRDLEYHDEMLSLLRLPEQADRDAVMILHLGGTFGDKAATMDRFRDNFRSLLSEAIKRRLVLENDDVSWTVHDLLPLCEELNIPLVLDFHHHNILFDQDKIREGTRDIIDLYDRIAATWTRKGIRQKMHYSEQTASAITPRERRKHSARVRTLPPCPDGMDLMIEAKDKEQAVFELMRTFKLPGYDLFNDIIPYERDDESPTSSRSKNKNTKKNAADHSFLSWFKGLPGASFSDDISIIDLRSRGAGRGIVATRDISPDTTLFTIPRKGIIDVETSDIAKRLPDLFRANLSAREGTREDGNAADDSPKQDSWSGLILILIYEFLRGQDSPWKPYFDILPQTFETPMFWTDEELDELQASPTRGKVGRENAEAMFRASILPVIRQNPELFASSEVASDDQLIGLAHRMGSTIMAYAFDLENEDEQEENPDEEWVEDRQAKSVMGMVPMADILNADAEFNAHVNHGDESLSVVSLRPIKAGDEILNYYGPHPNSELLRRYGYVTDKHARHDVVELPWSDVERAMASELGVSTDKLSGIRKGLDDEEFEDTFVLEREAGDIGPDGMFEGPPGGVLVPEELTEQLKFFVKAVKKLDPEAVPEKRKRREIMESILARAVVALEARYPTSVEEDERLLSQGGLSERHRMAVVVRLGEKRLLRETKAQLAQSAEQETEGSSGKKAKRS